MFLSTVAYALEGNQIKIVREVKKEITIGDTLSVNISIYNNDSSERMFEVDEQLGQDINYLRPRKPSYVQATTGIPFLHWYLSIPSYKIMTLTYEIQPKKVGEYSVPPTKVTDLSSNKEFFSAPLSVIVNCNDNGVCDAGEDYFNCQNDCKSGSKDGVCDYVSDNICDADCLSEPDCQNNNIVLKKENLIVDIVKNNLSWIFLGIAVVLLVLIIVLWPRNKEKTENI